MGDERPISRIGENVNLMNSATLKPCQRRWIVRTEFEALLAQISQRFWRGILASHQAEAVPVELPYHRAVAAAKADTIFQDRLKHGRKAAR